MIVRLLRGLIAALIFTIFILAFCVVPVAVADEVFPVPDSGNLVQYRGQTNAVGTFRVTGATDGTVYGTGIYTDDSDLGTAAVHAGMVAPGQTRDLRIEILPGLAGYQGSSSHGVTSGPYGAWAGSFKFLDQPSADDSASVLPDPGDLQGFRNDVGQTLYFRVTGSTSGRVYGDTVYTDDSTLAAAAVHAGVLAPGQTGVIAVTILPGQQHYGAAARHSISSRSYNAWDGSFSFGAAAQQASADLGAAADPGITSAPGNMTDYRDRTGQVFRFMVTGKAQGAVYGDGIYTDDSEIATAAVHAGVLADGERGEVSVKVLPGQPSYSASSRHGVTSLSFNSWQGSYEFVDPKSGQPIVP